MTPTKEECLKILKENDVPDNIIAHSQKVYEVAMKVCDILDKKGVVVNRNLAGAGAMLHDIAKAKPGDHVINGHNLIKSFGYPDVAIIISKHGLAHLEKASNQPKSTEEKVVFYSDKRVTNSNIVSVEKRFEYIKERYKASSVESEYKFTKAIENELLGDEKI